MKFALMFSALGLMAAAKEDSPPAGAASTKAAVKKVKVRVLINSLGEDSATYAKGEIFETSAERAEALGDSVELVN